MTIPIEAIRSKKAAGFERKEGRYPDFREELEELEHAGEIVVQRASGDVVEVPTKFGRPKKIQKGHLWHHKSCGQCGHIPGYSTSIFWVMRKLGYDYHDPKDQTSCTAWNYYAVQDVWSLGS